MARAEATFLSALDRPSEDRDAFLAGACAEDSALEAEVRAMLAAHREAGDFLQEPPLTPEIEAELARLKPEEEGERIGRYKLLQEIGEGGFGTVWMAEQMEPVIRRVALKIIKLGMDTREVIGRFEAERQALAMMDHPNIAKVLDAGATERGRPYFVMELVKGVPITQYCDEVGLGTRERLALFGDVCAAIHHAHQKGIIHRDIKPSNVMVTLYADKPVVKVIDFGIAKATQSKLTDKTVFTRFEQFIGTPVYMSPEQASMSGLDIDTRSDIYALGILLYELLTGKPPFDAKSLASAGYEEMRRIIREVEPPKPSSRLSTAAGEERTLLAKARHVQPEKLGRLVEPDLDWIVMKAIEKDRAHRYETASDFARDIAHFLADEPVSATPPSAGYKFRKFARRHKAALRIAGAVVAVLLAATAVSVWLAVTATRAKQETAQMLLRVGTERDEKELARKDAEEITKFLTAVFKSPDPARDGRTITVAEMLDKATKKLETDLATQPARRARLLAALGETYEVLGLSQKAIPLEEQVRAYALATHGKEHVATANALHNLANSYYDAGRYKDALALGEELLALRRKLHGPEDPDTLGSMHNVAMCYHVLGRFDEALRMHEEVLAVRRKVHGPAHPETLRSMHILASSYVEAGRPKEALELREEVLRRVLEVRGPEHPETILAMNNLAYSLPEFGRWKEAHQLKEDVLRLSRKVNGPEHPDTLMAMQNLANFYGEIGRAAEALALCEEVVKLRKAKSPEHADTFLAMASLATCHEQVGRVDDALKLREEVLALSSKFNGREHPDTLGAMHNLGNSYAAAGRREETLKLREELLALSRKIIGPERPATLGAMTNLALSYADAGRVPEALKLQEEVVALSRKVNGAEAVETLGGMTNLAMSYDAAGRLTDAIALQEQALALKRRALPKQHPFFGVALRHLAKLYAKADRRAEAAALQKEIAALEAERSRPEQPK